MHAVVIIISLCLLICLLEVWTVENVTFESKWLEMFSAAGTLDLSSLVVDSFELTQNVVRVFKLKFLLS